jgi:hypothetical protein
LDELTGKTIPEFARASAIVKPELANKSASVSCRKAHCIRTKKSGPSEPLFLFYLFNDGLKGFGVVHGQVGQCLAVDVDVIFVQFAHKNRV